MNIGACSALWSAMLGGTALRVGVLRRKWGEK